MTDTSMSGASRSGVDMGEPEEGRQGDNMTENRGKPTVVPVTASALSGPSSMGVNIDAPKAPFGLGSQRTLQQFQSTIGVNFFDRSIEARSWATSPLPSIAAATMTTSTATAKTAAAASATTIVASAATAAAVTTAMLQRTEGVISNSNNNDNGKDEGKDDDDLVIAFADDEESEVRSLTLYFVLWKSAYVPSCLFLPNRQ